MISPHFFRRDDDARLSSTLSAMMAGSYDGRGPGRSKIQHTNIKHTRHMRSYTHIQTFITPIQYMLARQGPHTNSLRAGRQQRRSRKREGPRWGTNRGHILATARHDLSVCMFWTRRWLLRKRYSPFSSTWILLSATRMIFANFPFREQPS